MPGWAGAVGRLQIQDTTMDSELVHLVSLTYNLKKIVNPENSDYPQDFSASSVLSGSTRLKYL